MGATKILWVYLLFALNIGAMFLLERKLTMKGGELAFIFFALVFAFLILRGINQNSMWALPALMVFIVMALVNNVYLFMSTKYLPAFLTIIVFNLFGMISAVMWLLEDDCEEKTEQQNLEFESYEDFSKRIDNQIGQLRMKKTTKKQVKK